MILLFSSVFNLFKNIYLYWREIFVRIFRQLREGEVQLVARSLSFSTILCLVPFIAVTIAILQSLAGSDALIGKVENFLLMNVKEAIGPDAIKVIKGLIQNVNLKKLGISGALFLFATSLRLLYDMEVGINRVWNIKIKRGFFKRIFIHVTLVFIIPIVLATYVSLNSLAALKIATKMIPSRYNNGFILFTVLWIIYKWVPSTYVRNKYVTICASLATLALFFVHNGFIFIAATIFNYRKIYGGFAAIPLFLLWIIAIWQVILSGSALSAALQSRKKYQKDILISE